MQSKNVVIPDSLQITFHFVNGQSQYFNIDAPVGQESTRQDVRQVIRRFMQEKWWTLKTSEGTIFINSENILSVEVNPPIQSIEGQAILNVALATELRN